MNTSSSSSNPFSPHKDVLEAPIPETTDGKQRLMQECKNRATSAVKASVWPDAIALYHKAIECCCCSEEEEDDGGDSSANNNNLAILYANLSFVHGKMNQWDAAVETAQKATSNDPAYTKAWWRQGQAKAALNQFDAAVDAIHEALKLEPQNKALLKELEKFKKQQQAAATAIATAVPKTTTTTATVSTSTKKTTSSSSLPSSKKASSTDAMEEDDDDEDEETKFTKSEHFKGYQVINGKKTTFFHNELSEEAARLIGDIAPKKLDSAVLPSSTTTSTSETGTTTKTTSKWNQAGTWEERDVSQWAEQTLTQKLQEASYTLPSSSPAPNASVTVTSVNLSGHASVATVRGKKRYIYEYSATVHWKFENTNNNDIMHENEATGSMQFPDIDGTCMVGEPHDVTSFQVDHADDNATLRPVLENFVHKQGLREALHHSIDEWVQMFRETY